MQEGVLEKKRLEEVGGGGGGGGEEPMRTITVKYRRMTGY